jgi:hypothetical protein
MAARELAHLHIGTFSSTPQTVAAIAVAAFNYIWIVQLNDCL